MAWCDNDVNNYPVASHIGTLESVCLSETLFVVKMAAITEDILFKAHWASKTLPFIKGPPIPMIQTPRHLHFHLISLCWGEYKAVLGLCAAAVNWLLDDLSCCFLRVRDLCMFTVWALCQFIYYLLPVYLLYNFPNIETEIEYLCFLNTAGVGWSRA